MATTYIGLTRKAPPLFRAVGHHPPERWDDVTQSWVTAPMAFRRLWIGSPWELEELTEAEARQAVPEAFRH